MHSCIARSHTSESYKQVRTITRSNQQLQINRVALLVQLHVYLVETTPSSQSMGMCHTNIPPSLSRLCITAGTWPPAPARSSCHLAQWCTPTPAAAPEPARRARPRVTSSRLAWTCLVAAGLGSPRRCRSPDPEILSRDEEGGSSQSGILKAGQRRRKRVQ